MLNRKKIMAATLSLLLAVSVSACGNGGTGSSGLSEAMPRTDSTEQTSPASNGGEEMSDQVTITLGMHVANTEAQETVTWNIVQAFMDANPGIVVDIQGNDKDEHVKKMKIAAQSDELPNIFWIDPSVAPELNDAGLLLDLNDFLNQYPEVNSAISSSMKEATGADGIQYGLPYQSLVTGFWYNKALFQEHNVPLPENGTTYEQLLEIVDAFGQAGVVPIAKGAKDPYSVWSFLIALERYGYFGKIDSILSDDEKFENPEFQKYFEKLAELGERGAFSSNSSTMTYFQAKEQFVAGNAAMFDSGMWDAGELGDALGENIGFWWGPTFSDTSNPQQIKMKVSSAPFCVSRNVEKDESVKSAVYTFLAYYYGEEAAKISYEGAIIPATDYIVEMDMSTKPAFFAMVEALNDESWVSPKAQPDLVLSQAVQAQLYDSMYGTMLGTYTPQEALAKLDQVLSQ